MYARGASSKSVDADASARRGLSAGISDVLAAWPQDRTAAILPLSVALLALFDVVLAFIDPAAHLRLSSEDGLAENLGFSAALVAGVYVLCTLRDRRCRVFQLLMGVAFIWLAGEEISWGQRLFGIVTPDSLAAINVQHELNVHNIDGITQRIKPVGASLLLFYAFGLQFLYAVSGFWRRTIDRTGLPLFRIDALAALSVAVVIMALPRFLGMGNPYDETGELALAVSLLLFALNSTNETPRR